MFQLLPEQLGVIEQQLSQRRTEPFHARLQACLQYAATHDWTTGAACPTLQLSDGQFSCGSCGADVDHRNALAHLSSEEHLSSALAKLQQQGAPTPLVEVACETLLALHQYLGLGSELIAAKHRGNKNIKERGREQFGS